MQPLDQVSPDETSALLMENELLRYEVTHLRARVEAAEAGQRNPKGTKGKGKPGPKSGPRADDEIARRNQQAYDDVRWLVRRLDSTPLSPALRRFAGFRTMCERYGTDR